MGNNKVNIDKGKIQTQIMYLNWLKNENLTADKIENLNSLIGENKGGVADTLLELNATLLEIEQAMTTLIGLTTTMLYNVDIAFENVDNEATEQIED